MSKRTRNHGVQVQRAEQTQLARMYRRLAISAQNAAQELDKAGSHAEAAVHWGKASAYWKAWSMFIKQAGGKDRE